MDNETYKSLICDSCKKNGTADFEHAGIKCECSCDEDIVSFTSPDGIETTRCNSFDTNRKGLVW